MGEVYGFASTGNVELRFRFFQLALSDHKSDVAKHYTPTAVNWIVGADGSNVIKGMLSLCGLKKHQVIRSRTGRMKFCRPIFRMASQVDKALTQEVFKESKDAFHPIARRMIEKVSVLGHFCILLLKSWQDIGLSS